ncbi:MAG: hypothetical protein GY820_38355 [Gammaproteobacteria bacterium]|nr:hypothetical protein [Gammaproteobacteria bacterium]
MPTEKLIVEIDAKTKKLDAKLNQTDKRLSKLEGSTAKADKSFAKFSKGAAGAAVAVTAVAASIGLAIKAAGQFARELEVAANRAGESVETMQSLAFATNTVGVSLEKLGDMAKDTNEKVGEYLATGGGGFQDFADVLGLTAREARAAAEEFQTMSGPDVLQSMVDQMSAAGVSAEQMSFALEGMASDTTDLIPLLENGGEKLKALRNEFDDLGVTISAEDIKKIKDVTVELDKMTNIFSNQGKQLIADYSEEIISVINATVTVAQKTADAFEVITTGLGNIVALAQAAYSDLIDGTDTFAEVLAERSEMSKEALNDLLGQDFYEIGAKAGKDAAEGFADEILHITIKKGKRSTAAEKKEYENRLTQAQKFFAAGQILNETFFNDNKAIAAGLIIADTAAAVMKSLSISPYDYGNVALIIATGIAQLSNALSASKGGGSIAGSGGRSGGSGGGSENVPAIEEPETSTLEVQERGDTSRDITITFATDTGDDLLDALAGGLNEKQRRGS